MELSVRVFVLTLMIVLLSLVLPLHYLASQGRGREIGPVRGFERVSLETRGRLHIIQGDSEYLTVEAPAEMVKRITAKVRGKTLHIGYRGIFTGAKAEPVFTLGMKNVRALIAAGSGEIRAESINSTDVTIDSSSSGDIDIERLIAEKASIRVDSSGSVDIARCALTDLEAVLSSSGDLRISGEAKKMRADCSSSGRVDGADLKVAAASVKIGSSGGVVLWVTDLLDADLGGKGDLGYYGEPRVAKERTAGSGRARKLGSK